jgi:hypothetical protein
MTVFLQGTGYRGNSGESGGVGVRAALATVTLAIIAALIVVVLRSAGERQETDHRKAVRISEYGLQEALNAVQEKPSWTAGFPKTACDGGWYSVTVRRFAQSDTVLLEIRSEGTKGRVSDVKECLLVRVSGGVDSLWVPRSIH